MEKRFVSAIITAAGNSTRMGKDKIFLQLNGNLAVAYTLEAFERADTVDEIIIVCKNEHRPQIKSIINECCIKKFVKFAQGSSTRQGSVFSGIKACNAAATHYAIHDAARCLITSEEINMVVADAWTYNASALGVPCKDTIKIVDEENVVVGTPARSTLRAIQTPQVFDKNLYLAAMKLALKDNENYTDDCQLVEHMGQKVHIATGNYSNLKLTTPDDIAIFENILRLRGNEA